MLYLLVSVVDQYALLAYWTSYLTPYNSQNECNHCCNRNIFVVVVNLLHKSSHSCCVRFHCIMSYCTKLSISITQINEKQTKQQQNNNNNNKTKQKSNKKTTTNKQRKKNPVGSMKMHKEVGYDRMTGVKNVRSFLSSYLEKDNSLGGHHLLVGEWPTLVTKFCACFAIRRASAEFHCSLHLKIKSIKIFHNFFLSLLLLIRCILSLSLAF